MQWEECEIVILLSEQLKNSQIIGWNRLPSIVYNGSKLMDEQQVKAALGLSDEEYSTLLQKVSASQQYLAAQLSDKERQALTQSGAEVLIGESLERAQEYLRNQPAATGEEAVGTIIPSTPLTPTCWTPPTVLVHC